jgi:hypothetical protein
MGGHPSIWKNSVKNITRNGLRKGTEMKAYILAILVLTALGGAFVVHSFIAPAIADNYAPPNRN